MSLQMFDTDHKKKKGSIMIKLKKFNFNSQPSHSVESVKKIKLKDPAKLAPNNTIGLAMGNLSNI